MIEYIGFYLVTIISNTHDSMLDRVKTLKCLVFGCSSKFMKMIINKMFIVLYILQNKL